MFRYLLAAVLMLSSALAMADGLSYSYVQAAYQEVDVDVGGGDVDGDGFSFGGSVAIGDEWYVVGGYSSADFDFGVDLDELSIGLGYHRGISSNTDFIAELAYVNGEIDAGAVSFDDSGIGATIGLRSMVSDKVELFGTISYVDFDDFGDGTSFGVGGWYTVSGNFALGLGASFGDDVSSYGIGARLYFDR